MKDIQKNMPVLRFKEFEGEWNKSALKKEAIVNPRTNKLPEKFIYIDLESVTKGTLVKESEICLNEAPSRAQRLLDKDDILYQTVRPYQKNNLYFDKDGDYVASTGYAQIKAKGDSRYLFHFLHTTPFVNVVNRWSTGTSYPAISPSELVKIPVAFPTLLEQQKIASFLSTVDKKIQQLTKKKTLLEQYKKGVMQQLFSQKLRFKPDTSTPLNERNGNLAAERSRSYPDWEEKRLGDISESIKSGKSKASENGLIPLYGSTGIIGKCSSSSHQGKFILIARVGANAGTINLIDDNFGVSDNTLVVVCKPILVIGYIYYFLGHYNLSRLIFGSGQPLITGGQLKALKFKLPNKEEQQKIANYLSVIDTKIESVNNQINKTQSFKKGLLQQMFI